MPPTSRPTTTGKDEERETLRLRWKRSTSPLICSLNPFNKNEAPLAALWLNYLLELIRARAPKASTR